MLGLDIYNGGCGAVDLLSYQLEVGYPTFFLKARGIEGTLTKERREWK